MPKVPFKIQTLKGLQKVSPPVSRRPIFAGLGRLRKVGLLGGSKSLRYAPWYDSSWELWSHASCRHLCKRDPDLLFDLHPPELWRNPKLKIWDPNYLEWLGKNRIPIMMQEAYPDAPASIRYPFETMITEWPRGYMTNTLSYMVALALMEGVTHLGVFGCNYETDNEYGPQRGCAEYWLGIAEGRGVHVQLPPLADLLGKPALLYGYQSHPNGVRDPSYIFGLNPLMASVKKPKNVPGPDITIVPADGPDAPKLMDIGVPPATSRRDSM